MAKCLNQRNNNEIVFLSNRLQLFNFSSAAHVQTHISHTSKTTSTAITIQ